MMNMNQPDLRLCRALTIALVAYGCCCCMTVAMAAPETEDSAQLKGLLLLDRKHQQADEQQAFKQQEKHKFELKNRLHKLIDEMVDTKLDQQEQAYPAKTKKSESKLRNGKSKKSQSSWSEELLSNNLMNQQQLQPAEDDNQKIVIIVKQQPELLPEIPIKPGTSVSTVAAGGAVRPPVDREHMRRILDDAFKIRSESLFTGASNHLGLKGGPKFGPEEEY